MGCPVCGSEEFASNLSIGSEGDGVYISITYHNVVVCLNCGVLYNSSIAKKMNYYYRK